MKEKQRQVIKDFSQEIYNSYSPYEAFVALADQWDLASNFERLLGSEGRISFPVERPQVEIGNIESDLRSLERVLRAAYDTNRFNMEVSAPSNKLEITVWDVKEDKPIIRRSYNKILDFLYRNTEDKDKSYFFDQSDIVDKANRIAQKISQRSVKQKGMLYISALPEDILTASVNSQGWSSCFDTCGENSVTPFHLVRSRRALITFFIPDSSENKTFEYCGHEIYNKYWRTFIYQSTDGSFFASSQSYPEQSESLTLEALNKLIELDGRDGTISDRASARYYLKGYCDGLGLAATFELEGDTHYEISSPHEICPLSKEPYDSDFDQSITCDQHTDGQYCDGCGTMCRKNELIGVTISAQGDEELYCEWCLDDTQYCEISGHTYTTALNDNTVSKFIDFDGNVHEVVTCYAEANFEKYTLTLYNNSDDYQTYELYGEGVHSLMNARQVSDIVDTYILPEYKLAILTLD